MGPFGKSLSARTCLVTGGAGGLGKAIALAFLANGANVVVCDLKQETLDQATSDLSDKGPILAVQCDITNTYEVKSLVNNTIEHFGSLDVLVNCAGIMDRFEPVGELSDEVWARVLAVNLTAPFLMSKEVVAHFMSRNAQDASIINIGSLASQRGWAGGAAYTTSKHALVGLTRSTAAYYKNKGIRCNLVMPGGMNTRIAKSGPYANNTHEEGQRLLDMVVDALATPISDTREVANLCVFLASKDSSALNGALITVDKGQTSVL